MAALRDLLDAIVLMTARPKNYADACARLDTIKRLAQRARDKINAVQS